MMKIIKKNKNVIILITSILFIVLLVSGGELFNMASPDIPDRGSDPPPPDECLIKVTEVSRNIEEPTSADTVSVSAKVLGATNVYLAYDDPIIGETSVRPMTKNGDYYYKTIPTNANGESISYWIKATDATCTKLSGIYSYIVFDPPGDDTTPTVFKATFDIYKKVVDDWVLVPSGGTLSGRIKIKLNVTLGASEITSARMSFWKVVDGTWLKQDVSTMAGTGVQGEFELEYDTTKLENAYYDILYELIDGDGGVVMIESVFGGGTEGLGINSTTVFIGMAGVVIVGVIIKLSQKNK